MNMDKIINTILRIANSIFSIASRREHDNDMYAYATVLAFMECQKKISFETLSIFDLDKICDEMNAKAEMLCEVCGTTNKVWERTYVKRLFDAFNFAREELAALNNKDITVFYCLSLCKNVANTPWWKKLAWEIQASIKALRTLE